MVERVGIESERADQVLNEPGLARRQIRIARVGSSHMSAQRALDALRVGLICERVEVDFSIAGIAVGCLLSAPDQRLAGECASDHRGCQTIAQLGVASGLLIEIAPELPYILLQFANDEIAAIAS